MGPLAGKDKQSLEDEGMKGANLGQQSGFSQEAKKFKS